MPIRRLSSDEELYMLMLVSYDVSTVNPAGPRRLVKIGEFVCRIQSLNAILIGGSG